ncbi:hypothetical protein CUMW_222380, partial [Citrus unshiu]
ALRRHSAVFDFAYLVTDIAILSSGLVLVELRVAELKKETLRRSFDLAHEQLGMFTAQWIEELFDLTMKSLEEQSSSSIDVDMKIRLLEERAKEIESKENELVLVEKKIKDCNFELACKEKELGLVRKRNGVCNSELQSKEDELNLVKNSAEKWPKRLNLKKEEQKRLESLDGKAIEGSEKELVLRKEQKASIRAMIEACTEKLEAIEESYDAAKAKLESEKKELELTQTFMKDLLVKRSLHEDNIQSLQSTIRLRENELECKEKELELKEREFCRIQERIEESSQELLLKENQLKSVLACIEDCSKEDQFEEHVREFELREREFDSLRKAVEDSSKNLELRQKKLSDILQLHRKKSAGPENLTSSGRNLQILLNQHLQRHDVIFCKVFETIRRAADPALLVLDAMSGFYPHSREGYVGFDLSSLAPKINSQVQGEALKVAVEWKKNMEDTVKDSLVVLGFLHLLAAYKLASAFDCNELASLLDIVANHRQTPKLRRSLGFADEVPVTHHDVASEINPLVRDEAMKVAGEWKEKMRAAVENSLEVLGLLHLLGAFRLAPAFDGNELESLLAIVAEDRQTPKLCRSLGFADKVP